MSLSSPAGTACPVCGSSPVAPRPVSLHGFPLLHCPACGHDWLYTEGADLSAFYDMHYAGFREDPVFNGRVREVIATSIAPLLPAGARVLDVGCGNGEFLVAARERGYGVLGLDFAQAAADACAKRGVRAAAGDFLRHDFGGAAPFDLVTMWDVCEHLDRPFEFVQRARDLLAPGGWLVLKVPCVAPRALHIAESVPRVAGALLGSPSHIQYFRPDTLTTLLRRAGFPLFYIETLAPMRGQRPAKSLATLAKRKLIRGIGKVAGNANTLVRAQVSPEP